MDSPTVSSRSIDPRAIPVALEVNGAAQSLAVAPYVTLLDLLRERLQLTGTKKGCDHGQCGAWLAVTADGARVTTAFETGACATLSGNLQTQHELMEYPISKNINARNTAPNYQE